MQAPLLGVRTVEIGDPRAVGYAGRLFADLGAEVTRVEASGAVPGRIDALALCLSAGKTVVPLSATAGEMTKLLGASQVALVGPSDSPLLDADRIAGQWPHLVVVAVTPFGMQGQAQGWAADDLTLQARGGISLGIGLPGRAPLKLPGDQSAFQSGLCAAIAALATLFARRGALIDLSALAVWASFYSGVEVALAHFGRHKKVRAGHRVMGQPYPRTILRCKDGYFAIQCGESRHWQSFLRMIEREDLLTHPLLVNRFAANDQHGEACDALIEPWFVARTKEEVLRSCLAHKIPGAPVYELGEVLAHPHLIARDFFTEIDSGNGRLKVPGTPFRSLARTSGSSVAQDAGSLSGPRPTSGRATSRAPAEKQRPLQGIRVVDFGWVWAGAVPGHILADLGAEVIKLESTSPLDYMRQGRPIVGTRKDPEQNPMFQNVNRGKLSFRIRLDHPRARAVVRDLVAASDVVIENFSPGVMEKFGLSDATLREARPDLVMCSMSAVGQSGPLRAIRTYATMIASLAGLDGLVAYPGGRVLGSQSSYADPNASLHAALAILAALWRRARTGEGAYIDLSQWEACVSLMAEQIAEYGLQGSTPVPRGLAHPDKAPHGHYPAHGEDQWIAISVATDDQWRSLARTLGNPPWTSFAGFAEHARRLAHRDELDRRLGDETRRHDAAKLAASLAAAGVPAAPLLDAAAMAASPPLAERQLFELVEHPVLGKVPVYRLPWLIDRAPLPITRRAPLLGEHNRYVLHDLLGYSDTQIGALEGDGLFA